MVVWQSVLISAVVVTLYTYVGGMWAISITDFIQSIIIIIGLLLLAFVLSQKAGGLGTVLDKIPREDLRFFPKFEFKEIMIYLAAWSVLGLGSIPSQDVFQRCMSSGSAGTAIRSCFYAAGLYLTIAMLPIFISVCAQQMYGDQLSGDAQLALPNMVLMHMNLPIQILFFGSLLSAIMSTASSAILAPASIFSENLVKPLFRHKLDDKHFLLLTKISVLIFSAVATLMACLRSNIYELVGESSILSLVSLFIPLVMGLYWKRASRVGAMIAMVAGIITWIIFEVYETSWPSLLPATLASLIGMIGGSLQWPQEEKEYDQDRTQSIE